MAAEFEIEIRGEVLKISEHYVGANQVFRIIFNSPEQTLIITKTQSYSPGKFWTSIPEGRQKEAEEIGNLITEFFKKK